MFEPENLDLWTMPDNYAGAVWPNWYVFLGQHRDSDRLTQSNFAMALAALGGESSTVRVIHEGHWAVGWVEWIGIHADDELALKAADEMTAALSDYPVLDESDFHERELNAACDYWAQASISDRVEAIKHAGANVSIFAARRDYFPERDDNGALFDYCRE